MSDGADGVELIASRRFCDDGGYPVNANQSTTRRARDGAATIHTATDTPIHPRKPRRVRKAAATPVPDRPKSGPTRKRADGSATTSPLLPWRRQAPAPTATPTAAAAGKRPAGRTPKATLPGRQVPHTGSQHPAPPPPGPRSHPRPRLPPPRARHPHHHQGRQHRQDAQLTEDRLGNQRRSGSTGLRHEPGRIAPPTD
jgi:hypothetical protein